VFIKESRTLFAIEDAFQRRKHDLASKIQAIYKGRLQRRRYLRMREAVTTIAKYWKRVVAMRELRRRRHAAQVIRG
jgi:myosin-1